MLTFILFLKSWLLHRAGTGAASIILPEAAYKRCGFATLTETTASGVTVTFSTNKSGEGYSAEILN
jgi:hypothetical protein